MAEFSLPGVLTLGLPRRSSALDPIEVQPLFYPDSLPFQISPIPESGGGSSDATSIRGIPVTTTPPTDGQALVFNAGTNQIVWRTIPAVSQTVYSCPAGMAVGDPAYETADLTVAPADAVGVATAPALGLIATKPTPTTCTILQVGELQVPYALPADDSELFLSIGGGITSTAPTAHNSVVQGIAQVVSQAGRILMVHIDPENYYLRA